MLFDCLVLSHISVKKNFISSTHVDLSKIRYSYIPAAYTFIIYCKIDLYKLNVIANLDFPNNICKAKLLHQANMKDIVDDVRYITINERNGDKYNLGITLVSFLFHLANGTSITFLVDTIFEQQ